MAKYIVNTNEDNRGYHEVHTDTCGHLPFNWNQEELGSFAGCSSAVAEAERRHPSWKVDGCYYCSENCHVY